MTRKLEKLSSDIISIMLTQNVQQKWYLIRFFQTRWKLINTISVRWKNLNLLFFINEMFLSNTCIWISWRCYLDLIIFKAVIFERSRVSREFSIRYAWLKIMSAFNRVIFYLDLRFNVCINVWEKKRFPRQKNMQKQCR